MVTDNGTPGDTTDDIVTGDGEGGTLAGRVSFKLTTVDNGTAEVVFTIPAGTKLLLTETGLPTGITYETVATANKNSDQSTVGTYRSADRAMSLENADITENLTVTFTNSQIKNLTISKTVTGAMAVFSDVFDFRVSGLTPGKAYKWNRASVDPAWTWESATDIADADAGTMTADANGGLVFKLRHQESIAISLPFGAVVSVSETSSGYNASYELDDNGTVTSGKNVENIKMLENHKVDYVNERPEISPTGITLHIMPYALMMIMGVAMAAIMLYSKKRRMKEN